MKRRHPGRPRLVVGWREWAALPELGVPAIKVKVDTGARTSALHAFRLRRFQREGAPWVRFEVHPVQRVARPSIAVEAVVVDERLVRSSTGHEEERPVIETVLALGSESWPIHVTLTRRDAMGFRMLLGRQGIRGRVLVDPGRSFVLGRRVAPRGEGDGPPATARGHS
ncbi:MAG: ATP-dependent zinc protease [Gemmatimonadetes bacterium]|nr:MAG: ATP-dependent zinc protease [Gemmatimonadota bacterium]